MPRVLLTSVPPPFPFAPSPTATILVFDATLAGYRNALQWLNANPVEEVYRQIIPFASDSVDVGDWLFQNKKGQVLGTADKFSKEFGFMVQRIDPIKTTDQVWPYPSQQRIVDYQKALDYLESQLLLRDAGTGLNALQQYMLQCTDEADEVKARCSAHFKMPMNVVRQAYDAMYRGNHPPTSPFPLAMVNGPKPLDPKQVLIGIEKWLNFKKPTDWATLPPSCPPYLFQGDESLAVPKKVGIQPPYGFPDAQRFNVWHEPLCVAKCPPSLPVQWDPEFLQGTMDQQTYLNYWLEQQIKKLGEANFRLVSDREHQERKREFARMLYVGATGTIQRKECTHEFKLFLEENLEGKRRRLFSDFDNDQELMEMPVKFLDYDFFKVEATEVEPKDPCDQLLELLKKYLE